MTHNRNDMSSYFYFDDNQQEVCFKRYDTPTPWINYLFNGTLHTMISQAGGGLVFYKSPQIWRISRYRFFHLPTDRSGPYLYIQDDEKKDYWCPTNEPAFTKPDSWKAAHGMGYTRFEAKKNNLDCNVTYFVGDIINSLIWDIKIKNRSHETKKIRLFAYVEFSMMEFMRELQWQCYNKHQVSVCYDKEIGTLVYKYGVEMQPKPDETPLVYFTGNILPDAYDGDRDEFIGTYRSESNPYAVENSGCTNSTLMGGDPCGALEFNIIIEPGKTKHMHILLGTAMNNDEIKTAVLKGRDQDFTKNSFKGLSDFWKNYLNRFICNIPNEKAQRMVNIWNPYQVQRNFLFSRNISYYATGTFRGVGFRDTSQDILAMIPFDVIAAKEKNRLLLTQQYKDGHVNHYFFPTESWEPVKSIHSDDHLWPILTVWHLLMETGDINFLNESIPYYDGGEGTLYEHLVKAINFSKRNLGENGFPLMLRSDWNDALFKVCREGRGESIWTSMQLGVVLLKLSEIAVILGKKDDAKEFLLLYKQQKQLINKIAWDGKWFRRAVMDDGRFLGTNEHDEAKIWLNTQTWSVISGMAEGNKGIVAMDSVFEILDTELGIKKVHPAIKTFPDPNDPLTNYNPGTGENGAVFCHANTWAIIAECILGRGERAWKYYHQLLPEVVMEKAGVWRYKAEPYVYSSNIFGPESDKFGLANVSFLTGTAAWMYIAITQYILGIRPTWEGIILDPCIPSCWEGYSVTRNFRGCIFNIKVINESQSGKGVKVLLVDGEKIEGVIIPFRTGKNIVNVEAIL